MTQAVLSSTVCEKKSHGRNPVTRKAMKFGSGLRHRILKTKYHTPICIRGLSRDQAKPRTEFL